jgi:hypothetical protein
MIFEGIIRRFTKQDLGGAVRPFRMTGLESHAVAQVEEDLTDLARAGRLFYGGNQIIANGIAPVAAIPTTTATLALVNKDANNTLAISKLNFWLGSGTPAAGATLFACVVKPTQATADGITANGTGFNSANRNPVSSRKSGALWTTALTVPATTVWEALLSTMQLAAANIGQGDGISYQKGGLLVPPFCALGIGILSGAGTTPLYGVSAEWAELELENE